MGDETRRLRDELIHRILDGEPVDWNAEEARQPARPELIEELRILEGVAQTYRAAARDTASAPVRFGAPPLARPAAAAPDAGPVGIGRWGPLVLLERIGQGAYGEVYRAWDSGLHHEVALKLRFAEGGAAPPAARLEEARRLARVRQRNVVQVYGVDVHDRRVGLWTELLDGRTLEDMLGLIGTFGAEEAAVAGVNLCRALAAVHEAGLIHGDVKTSNVMRERGGRFVLLDFGSVTEPGAFLTNLTGTPLAMAPELFGDASPSRASDLYALGVLLYRLVSARYPVEGGSTVEIATRHAQHAGTPLRDLRPDLPGDFVRVVERSLDPDPGRRFLSAGAMERALAISLGSMTPSEHGRMPRPQVPAGPVGAPHPPAPPELQATGTGPERTAGPLALVLWIAVGALIGAALLLLAQRIWG